jgi:hypothetical protein
MHQPITSHHIMAQHTQNQCLSDFVKQGLRDFSRGAAVSLDMLLGQLAQEHLSQLDNLVRFSPSAPSSRKSTAGTDQGPTPDEFAFTRYVGFIAKHASCTIARVAPVHLMRVSEEQYTAILAATGLTVTPVAVTHVTALFEEPDLVVTAWNKARENRERALQRAGALLYLASQVPARVFGPAKAVVEQEVNEALSVLYRMAATFQATELEFAVILGGEALEGCRKRVLHEFLHPGASLVQYLHTDQDSPDLYASETHDNFRAALSAHAQEIPVTAT